MGKDGDINNMGATSKATPALCSQRWNLAVLAFFGFLFVYVNRVNFSVAIICMRWNLAVLAFFGFLFVNVNRVNFSVAIICMRWNLAVLAFFGFLFVYVNRVNFSVAIICMVRVPRHNQSYDDVNSTVAMVSPYLSREDYEQQGENAITISLLTGDRTGSKVSKEAENLEETCGEELMQDTAVLSNMGEFDWDKLTRSRLLAMYFYGYIFTQIPGGWLAGRYGGRRVWAVCQAVCALCTLFIPLAARASVYLVYALRFLLGLGAGVSFPCYHAMMGRWAPKLERSKLVSFAFSGAQVGTILTFSLSALLCAYGFDNGWGSIFYLTAIGNLLWVAVWFSFTADTPAVHKRISEAERDYIVYSIGARSDTKKNIPTPWKAMFTSGPLWAIIFAHMCNNYTNYTLQTSMPAFLKEVLKFDVKRNGALSALPYLCQAISCVLFGQLADFVRARGYLSTKNTRKVIQITSFVGIAVCISLAGFLTCDQRPLSILVLCLCLCFMGLNRSAYAVNHIDLAPRHAGVLYGITNSAGTIPGMVAPIVVGALTPNRTPEEWRRVFFICAGLACLGALLYGWLADGEQQSWAAPPSEDRHLAVATDAISKEDETSDSEPSDLKIINVAPEDHLTKAKSSDQ